MTNALLPISAHDRGPPRALLLAARRRGDRTPAPAFGCETRIFDPSELPLPDQIADDDHPAVEELRQHSLWSEGQVW